MKYILTPVFVWVVLSYFMAAIAPQEVRKIPAQISLFNAGLALLATYILHLWVG